MSLEKISIEARFHVSDEFSETNLIILDKMIEEDCTSMKNTCSKESGCVIGYSVLRYEIPAEVIVNIGCSAMHIENDEDGIQGCRFAQVRPDIAEEKLLMFVERAEQVTEQTAPVR